MAFIFEFHIYLRAVLILYWLFCVPQMPKFIFPHKRATWKIYSMLKMNVNPQCSYGAHGMSACGESEKFIEKASFLSSTVFDALVRCKTFFRFFFHFFLFPTTSDSFCCCCVSPKQQMPVALHGHGHFLLFRLRYTRKKIAKRKWVTTSTPLRAMRREGERESEKYYDVFIKTTIV